MSGQRYKEVDVGGGLFPIDPLALQVGLWEGTYQEITRQWLPWYDAAGNLIPTSAERAERERARLETERARAEKETARAETEAARGEEETVRAETQRARAERLAARLSELGEVPDSLG